MNYLAHLFLSEPTDERRIGSLLADFSVGMIADVKKKYGEEIAKGIKHHREIDRYTDTHPVVAQSVERLRGEFGLYSGIVVDVVYDHFLLKHWDLYTSISQEAFFQSVYRSLDRWDWEYPERYRKTIERMLQIQWLNTYQELENVAYALMRIGERFPRKTPLEDTLGGLKAHYDGLDSDFLTFFPELMAFSASVDCRV